MLLGFYTGVSGVHYNEQRLEVTSANLANVDTTGFRRSLMVLGSRDENRYTKRIDPAVRERLPRFYGTQRTGVYKIYKEAGRLQRTNNLLDLAIPAELKNAFFQVRRADPSDQQTYYTRNGTISFGPSEPGSADSPSVLYLGGHIALDESKQTIEINSAEGPVTVSGDGVVRQGEEVIGEIPLYRLNKNPDPATQQSANLQRLLQLGDSLFKVPDDLRNEFYPRRLEVGDEGAMNLVIQGMRESSNVNPITELMALMEANKGYSANVTAIKSQADSLSKLFQVVRS